ncbi:hypothetical protein HW932_18395 [Allochromatium humboldtianum]|uniref:Uncharacterized protein n=1 Tax=Allochromatium humboldtianum TaxID=504901 RepID=A0A850RB68_9GAMM|nr:hypothetical protein [Allochromatium humboldtianum]NVZ11224.1 hypothetical protein [Allochromatium humboldtianum]
MENFIDDLIDLNNNNNYGGARAHERFSVAHVRAKIEGLGGTVVLDCVDFGGDRVILFSKERHYPDALDENSYCVAQITADGSLTGIERGTFDECFACFVEWNRAEVAQPEVYYE